MYRTRKLIDNLHTKMVCKINHEKCNNCKYRGLVVEGDIDNPKCGMSVPPKSMTWMGYITFSPLKDQMRNL